MSNMFPVLFRRNTIVWLAFAVCCYSSLGSLILRLYAYFFIGYKEHVAMWLFDGIFLLAALLTLVGVLGFRAKKLWGRIWAGCAFLGWTGLYISVIYFMVTGNYLFYLKYQGEPPLDIDWSNVYRYSVYVVAFIAAIVVLALPESKTKTMPTT